jgi:hypothetical protein
MKRRSKWSKDARKTIPDHFVARLVEMLDSPAWRTLSLSARRLLDRLDLENRRHGGLVNGKLIVTFEQFCSYGMDRHAVAPAIREAIALGFVEITRQGCAGNADQRQPNQYRLTYHPAEGVPGYGSNEWRAVTTSEEANRIAIEARRTPAAGPYVRRAKNKKPVGGNTPPQRGDPPPKTGSFRWGKTHWVPVGKTPTTIDISTLPGRISPETHPSDEKRKGPD